MTMAEPAPRRPAGATIRWALDNLVWFILLVIVAGCSAGIPGFFQTGIFLNIAYQATFVGILSVGLSFCIIAGQIDLSIESVLAFSAMLAAYFSGMSTAASGLALLGIVSLAIVLAFGAVIGIVNAFFIVELRITAFAGWLLAARTNGATPNLGIGMLFEVFAAVVIGGVSLAGGVGRLSGVFAGALLLSSISTAINIIGLEPQYMQVIRGLLMLVAVLLDSVKRLAHRYYA